MLTSAPSLKRSMKMLGNMLITVSVITPASSIFIIAPGVVQQAGTGAFLAFAIAAIVCVCTALVYAELSSAYPLAGGEYAIIGRVLGPFPGFIALGLNFITLVLIVSVIALGIGNYTEMIFGNAPKQWVAVGSVIVTTLLAILNIRTNAIITGVFLAIEIIALIVLAWLGFDHVSRPLADIVFHPVALNGDHLGPASMGMIGLATSVAIFAYNGYGSAVYFGEETHDAPKHVAQAILWSLVVGVIAEWIPITAVLLGAPDLQALFSSSNMLSDFIGTRGGATLNTIISLGIALAILNANIASILLVARLLFSSGRDHVWSRAINHALSRVHPRFHSPWIATLACGVLASFACFIDMNLLLVITGTSLVVIYASLCVAALAGRRKGLTAKKKLYRMPLYPLPPIAALVMLGYVIYANYLDEAIGRPSLIATAGMMLISAGYYWLVLRRKGKWELRGPDDR
jgi:amino acid transporter